MNILLVTESAFVILDYDSYRALSSDPLTVEAFKVNPFIARHYDDAIILDNTGDEVEIPLVKRRLLSIVVDYR